MTETQKIFDKIFSEFGGVYYPDDLPLLQQYRSRFNDAIRYLKPLYTELPKIEMEWVANLHLNAAATLYNDRYYVGSYFGAVCIIQSLTDCIFASKNIFPVIGNSSIEKAELKLPLFITDTLTKTVALDRYAIPWERPKDTTRQFASSILCDMLYSFLIFHELCHIIRGHCGFIIQDRKKPFFFEFGSNSHTLTALDHHTLEMDADAFATNHFYRTLSGFINATNSRGDDKAAWSVIYQDLESAIYYWIFALYCFFKISVFNSINPASPLISTHPDPSLRIVMILGTLYSKLRDVGYSSEKVDKIAILTNDATKYAEYAFSQISYTPNDYVLFLQNMHSNKRYIKNVLRNWNNIRPKIEPYAINPENLPPLSTVTDTI